MASKVKTAADFSAAHDVNVIVPNKVRAALAAMAKEGPENWEYESDFIKRAGVSQAQIGNFREQFKDYVVEAAAVSGRTGRRAWFADPKVAKKLRSN